MTGFVEGHIGGIYRRHHALQGSGASMKVTRGFARGILMWFRDGLENFNSIWWFVNWRLLIHRSSPIIPIFMGHKVEILWHRSTCVSDGPSLDTPNWTENIPQKMVSHGGWTILFPGGISYVYGDSNRNNFPRFSARCLGSEKMGNVFFPHGGLVLPAIGRRIMCSCCRW